MTQRQSLCYWSVHSIGIYNGFCIDLSVAIQVLTILNGYLIVFDNLESGDWLE